MAQLRSQASASHDLMDLIHADDHCIHRTFPRITWCATYIPCYCSIFERATEREVGRYLVDCFVTVAKHLVHQGSEFAPSQLPVDNRDELIFCQLLECGIAQVLRHKVIPTFEILELLPRPAYRGDRCPITAQGRCPARNVVALPEASGSFRARAEGHTTGCFYPTHLEKEDAEKGNRKSSRLIQESNLCDDPRTCVESSDGGPCRDRRSDRCPDWRQKLLL